MQRISLFLFKLILSSSLSFGLKAPNCTIKQDAPCTGITATGSSVAEMLVILHDHLCGCMYIEGNIHIAIYTTFPDFNEPLKESDFSFFYHLREISQYLYLQYIPSMEQLSLPNLRIIRGESLFSGLALATYNCRITTLYMPQLKEITRGNIFFRENIKFPSVCNVLNINWTDILSMDSSTVKILLPNCTDANKPNCSASLGCSSCWCDDSAEDCCQNLTSDCFGDCNGGRCNRMQVGSAVSVQCCSDMCAAGCTGLSPSDCRACTRNSVLNGGTCFENCPPVRIFDEDIGDFVKNPDFKFKLDGLCVKPCPAGTFELDSILCVNQCPTNTMSVPSETGGEKCQDCDGLCPKECVGGSTQSNDFINCTTILGSLRIAQPLPSDDPADKLLGLTTIQHITGSLSIELYNHETFPFLSNLKTVGSDFSEVNTFPCDKNTLQLPYSIYITETDLVSIDLSSLRDINGGGVSIDNNPFLCYIGDLSRYTRNVSADLCLGNHYRRPMEECFSLNLTCHHQCNTTYGCWGPKDTQCVECVNFEYRGRCVQSCENYTDLGIHLYNDVIDKKCKECHAFCKGSCSGKGPDHCESCLTNWFARIPTEDGGIECLNDSCPIDTYGDQSSEDGKIECIRCSSNCSFGSGCSGPLSIVDSNEGCLNCETVFLNQSGHQVFCTHDTSCPTQYYELEDLNTTFPNVSRVCFPCHELCLKCIGPTASDCKVCKNISLTKIDSNNHLVCTSKSSMNSGGIPAIIGIAVGGTGSLCIIIFLLGILVHYCLQKLKKSRRGMQVFQRRGENNYSFRNKPVFLEDEHNIRSKQHADKSIVVPTKLIVSSKRLTILESIGKGEFGEVYKAELRNDGSTCIVAVKTIRGGYDQNDIDEFLKESVCMSSLHNPNVMGVIGICLDANVTPYIILPYMAAGSLLSYLRKNKDILVLSKTSYPNSAILGTMKDLLRICFQIAKGMEYIAQTGLIHRDLAARNCMMDLEGTVKVADFGLAKGFYDKVYFRQEKNVSVKLPVKWLALESIQYGLFSEKSDVWAFGVTTWEVFSGGKIPYEGINPGDVLKMLKVNERMDKPENEACPREIYEMLMINCWDTSPDKRPTFTELVSIIDGKITAISDYLPVLDCSERVDDSIYI